MQAHLITPTPDLQQSIDFYTTLGFRVVTTGAPTYVTDGQQLIEINPNRYTRAGLKVWADDPKAIAEALAPYTHVVATNPGYVLAAPCGTYVYLDDAAVAEDFDLGEPTTTVLGNYAGLSLETVDIVRSIEIWKILGFTNQSGSLEQGWISLTNADGLGISLMQPNTCPHLFFNPSLTYFNSGKNPEVIAKVRELGIPITEEITVFNKEGKVDNIILRDPGGFGFFVFND